MQSELKPCPFCGSDKHMLLSPTCDRSTPYNPADRAFPVIRCSGCYTDVPGRDFDASGKSAVEAWNRRTALSAEQTQPVAVKELEWVDLGNGKAFRAFLPIIGSIRVEPYGVCGWWEVLWSMPGQCDKLIPDVFDTPDEAKAAAQADYEQRIRSALVDVPVEPVAIGYVSSAELQLLKQSATVVDLFSKPEPGPMEFIPLYIFPPLSREGEDTAEVYEQCAKLAEQRASWVRPMAAAVALKRLAQEIRALAATRSGSATEASGGDHG